MTPPDKLISSVFSRDEGQAKFEMVSTEWAEKILKEFEGRRVEGSDKQIEVYFEVSQPQLSRRQKQLNSGSPLNRLNQSYFQQSA
jgi:hypothetical protein